MPHRSDESALKKITKICGDQFVDLTAGADEIDFWKKEVARTYDRTVVPQIMILVLQRDKGKYDGAMYISREDFKQCQP